MDRFRKIQPRQIHSDMVLNGYEIAQVLSETYDPKTGLLAFRTVGRLNSERKIVWGRFSDLVHRNPNADECHAEALGF